MLESVLPTPPPGSKSAGLLFSLLLALFAGWVLSLPVFPSQDGPMHRYYVHVLGSLLAGEHSYAAYQIRHPFPPYATHYFSLLALSQVFAFDLAEKIFVVLVIVCLACGLRFCTTAVGPSGGTVSLFVFPVLLGWTLMMGFMNFTLGVALLLWLAGLWQRARARPMLWVAFVAIACLLTVTHPIPLLSLLALCALDLCQRFFWTRRPGRAQFWQSNWPSCVALGFLCVAFLFPAASIDKSKSASTFAGFGLHPQIFAKNAMLFGLSPYYAASRRPLVNLYRLSLYGVLAVALVLGFLALREALKKNNGEQPRIHPNLGQTLFVSALLLGLSLAILPDYVNGSGFFGTRMMVLVWLGALGGAAGYHQLRPRTEQILSVVALLIAAVTLICAEVYVRPLARDLAAIEREPLPNGQMGLVLISLHADDYARRTKQVAFDPYAWAAALPFVRADDVILDSPWIDQTITPLRAVPGGPELVDDIRFTQTSTVDPPFRPGASLPGSKQGPLVASSRVLIFTGDPSEIAEGIEAQLTEQQAAAFSCSGRTWYLVCVARPGS